MLSFGGLEIPITLMGAAFYIGLCFAAVNAPTGAKDDGKFHQVNAWFAIVSLAYSAFLGWASSQIGAVCAICISIYVGNAILLWAGLRGMSHTGTSLLSNWTRVPFSNAFVTTSIVFLIAIILGESRYEAATALPNVQSLSDKSDNPTDPAEVLATLYEAPRGPVSFDGSEPLMGDPNAPYMVVEFADFGCPHCAQAKEELRTLVDANPDIAVRFRYFPLTGACNPVLSEGTPERCYAAFAAECAHKQGKFWEMASLLFQNMDAFEPAALTNMAHEVSGLDLATWESCMADPVTLETITRSGEAGGIAGVQGTPAMFLKGLFPDTYVQVPRGAPAILALVEAHKDGLSMRSPTRD
jgi:protein-disulfide isomerase